MKKNLVVALIISGSLGFMNSAFSQAQGNLDQSFATSGELADSLIFPYKYSGIALSPGNEFVVSSASNDTIQVIRYTTAGIRDVNFGLNSAGYVQIAVQGFEGSVTASLVQTDRKILIAGQYANTGISQKAYLLRLNADGTPDSSFGNNGWFFFNFFPDFGESIHQIALQNNGNIVALDMENYPGPTDTFTVVRIQSNGTYDSSFAVNGVYHIPFYNFLATSSSVFYLDANNNFTFAAYSNYLSSSYFYLFQLNQNGVINTSYGNNGSILIDSTNIINGDVNLGLNFQSNGQLITVQSRQTDSLLWAVCRYNTNGTPDQSFGINGLVNVQPNFYPLPYSVENITSTVAGQIVTAGIVNVSGSNRIMVNSFNPDGSVNTAFGNNQGSELLDCFELDDIVYNILIDPYNNILINGLVNEQNYEQFEVVRLIGPVYTGVKEVNNSIDLTVYPNPANEQVSFQLSKPFNGTISLKDMNGNNIMTKPSDNDWVQTIDISNLAAGVYVLSFLDSENAISKMIVKQ